MSITHHLDPATLMSYAAGSLAPALAAVAAQHIAMCPHCQHELAIAERIGQELMVSLPAVDAPPPDLKALAERRERRSREIATFRARLGNLAAVRWRWIGPGLQHHRLAAGGSGTLHLLKAAPGAAVPAHDHAGDELTLVLEGALLEDGLRFSAGDIADHDAEDADHRPVADAQAGCICVIGAERKVRFRGLMARLVQPYHGM
ncbi:MAG: cupin domain-containing protein [Hyphomicrobiaceae bacterium]|nr:cupin domain-containing protein [Hyphomicrobiaceae bacterium]